MADDALSFWPGRIIAMKLPLRDYDATLRFYKETLGLSLISQDEDGAVLKFGEMRLNLDRVPHQSQTDTWLQICTNDTTAARAALADHGVTICDEVEPLPDGFDGFWIAAPNGTIHLIDAQPQGGSHG
jgi:catechol 2,3-dioxygenase-like lactoylglutathione lyase family enzyme